MGERQTRYCPTCAYGMPHYLYATDSGTVLRCAGCGRCTAAKAHDIFTPAQLRALRRVRREYRREVRCG